MDFTSITCIVVQIAYFFVWLPYWGDIFFQLGKKHHHRRASGGGVACVVVVRFFFVFGRIMLRPYKERCSCISRDVALGRLCEAHTMRRHAMTSLRGKQYDSRLGENKAKRLHFAIIANAHFCKNGLKQSRQKTCFRNHA